MKYFTTQTIFRFKVHYKVSDPTDQCSIVFFNDMAVKLFGKSALDMEQKLVRVKTITLYL